MGTLENTNAGVNLEEKDTLKKSFLRRVGGLSTEDLSSEARVAAAAQLGISVEQLTALQTGEGYTGMAGPIAGVNLGITDPAAVREVKQADMTARLTTAQIREAEAKADAATATLEIGNTRQEFTNPETGEKEIMTGFEYQSLTANVKILTDIKNTLSLIKERDEGTNWTTSIQRNFRRETTESALRVMGLNSELFDIVTDSRGDFSSYQTKAGVEAQDNAVLTLANIFAHNTIKASAGANPAELQGLINDASVSGSNFVETILALFNSDSTEGDAGQVKTLITNLNAGGEEGATPGTALITKLEGLVTTVAPPAAAGEGGGGEEGAAAAAAAPAGSDELSNEEIAREFAIPTTGLGSRQTPQTAEAAATVTPQPQGAPEAATEVRGMSIEDIGSNLADIYERIETRTSRFSSRRDLTLTQSENLKAMEKFLGDNRTKLNLKRKDVSKVLKKYERLNKDAAEGVRVTPQLVQDLITENAPAYNEEEEVARPARSAPLTPKALTQEWDKHTTGGISGREIPSDFNSAVAIQQAFKAYIAARGVLYPEQNALWLGYFSTHKNKTFSKASVDAYLTSQEIE